jgi:hypothetical protein
MKTLEELKAENAKAEEESAEVTATEAEETETEAVEEEEQESDDLAEDGKEESSEAETEAWMQSDEQTSDGAEFTGSDIAAAKRKLRAKLERQHNSELEELKKQIETLKGGNQQTQSKLPPRPKREDFDFDDDAYDAALDAWNDKRLEAKLAEREQSVATTKQQAEAATKVTQAVDQHYERAAKLVQEAGINADLYQDSDRKVRTAIEAVRPNEGDLIAEQLISVMGEGSEKVMYYIGRNKDALNGLQSAIINDPSGMQAMLYLGKITSKVANPQQRVSRAPRPAATIKGDASESSVAKALRKKYKAADKAGNVQERFNLRREAKKAGIDVSAW